MAGSAKRPRLCADHDSARPAATGLWASHHPQRRPLTQAIRLELAKGRRESRIVRWYLETIKARHATACPLAGLQEAWADLEHEFVEIAASFSRRYGIKRASWSEMGVEASVLDRSKIAK